MICLQTALANPGSEVMKKLDKSKVLGFISDEWIFQTVGEACEYALQNFKIAKGVERADHIV